MVKQGRHGWLPTNLAAMSAFAVMFLAGVVRLDYYHVALNQQLHQQVAFIFNTLLCYVWISMDVISEVISLLF